MKLDPLWVEHCADTASAQFWQDVAAYMSRDTQNAGTNAVGL